MSVSDKVRIVESATGQNPPDAPADAVPLPEVWARAHVRFTLHSDASPSAPEQAEEEEDDADSVDSNPPVVDKTLVRLAGFIHHRYPESHPLSAPPVAPRCGFESMRSPTLQSLLVRASACTLGLPTSFRALAIVLLLSLIM